MILAMLGAASLYHPVDIQLPDKEEWTSSMELRKNFEREESLNR